MLGTCEPTSDNGMLYVYTNKFWHDNKAVVDIAKFLDEKAKQEKMQQIEEEKKEIEDQIESAEDKATELGLIKEEPATKPAAKPAAAPCASSGCSAPCASGGCGGSGTSGSRGASSTSGGRGASGTCSNRAGGDFGPYGKV